MTAGSLCLLLVYFNSATAQAPQTATAKATADTTADAPSPTREVIASGSAAVGPGGVAAARKAAIAQAMRAAIEQTTGVYVSASTLTRNYQLVRDQVITHADGFATTEAVLKEVDGAREVRVTIKALVSLRPLAQRLQALNLTHAWRVHVTKHWHIFRPSVGQDAVTAAIDKALTDAGLLIVSSANEADIEVDVSEFIGPTSTQLKDPNAPEHARGQVSVRATLIQTGEVVASLDAEHTSDTLGYGTAHDAVLAALAADITPRLINALIVIPSRNEWTVQLEVGHIGSISRAERFQKALATLPEITHITRRRYEEGSGIWDLKVFSDNENEMALDLEQNAALKPYHLTVLTDSLVRIVAATDGVAPVFTTPATVGQTSNAVSTNTPPNFNFRPPPTFAPQASPFNGYPEHAIRVVQPLGSRVINDDLQYDSGGTLTGQNGGNGWSAPWIRHGWTAKSQIIAGGLPYPNLPTSKSFFRTGAGSGGEDRWFTRTLGTPGEVIYLSQTLRGVPASADSWNHNGFGYRVDDGDTAMTGVAFGKFEWDPRIIIRAAPAHDFVPTNIVAEQNKTYFLVVRITFGITDSKVELWVDPIPGRPLPPAPDATMTLRFDRISRYSALSGIPCDFGAFRIGNSYASVAPTK